MSPLVGYKSPHMSFSSVLFPATDKGGGGASASVKLQVNCGLADDCVISIASSSKHTVWSR